MDKVFIYNVHVRCIIGVNDWEREKPREILIDITLYTDTRHAAETDNIADCVDYDQLAQNIRALAEKANRYTIEALAEDIANFCLGQTGVRKVMVKLQKPHALQYADSVGVEIERKKVGAI